MTAPAPRPYRPSNGTEGEFFYDDWCARCERERAFRGGDTAAGCPIFTATLVLAADDPDYPREWVYGLRVPGEALPWPCCTAFVPEGAPVSEGAIPDARQAELVL